MVTDCGFKLPPEQQAIRDKCFHPSGRFEEFPQEAFERSIPHRFEEIVERFHQRLAVKSKTRTLTYRELNRAANRVAKSILENKGANEAPIVLLLENDAVMISAIFGAIKAGKIYVPLDASFPSAELAFMVEDCRAGLLVTNDRNMILAEKLAGPARRILNLDELAAMADDENLCLPLGPETLAYMMYTSGSTGQAKGVLQNHRNVLQKVMTHTNDFRISVKDRLSLLYSPSFSASVRCIFGALLNGASIFLYDVKKAGLAHLPNWLNEKKITLYFSVPTVFRSLCENLNDHQRISTVRLIYLGGEAVVANDIELFRKYFPARCILANSMASGETGTALQYFISADMLLDAEGVPVGYPASGRAILLLDETRKAVDVGEIGEIAVRSRYLSPGYWRRDELNSSKFLPDPDGGEERIYLTGDLARMRNDGSFEHLGRADGFAKLHGRWVDMAMVESALTALEGVAAAAVTVEHGAEELTGYIVQRKGSHLEAAAIRRALRGRLPDYMIPSAFVFMAGLPLTPTGKVKRRVLPKAPHGRDSRRDYLAPSTRVEEILANIWSGALRLKRVGINENFFDLGGHSLAASRIISRVVQAFQLELPLRALFDAPTVAEMAAVITQYQTMRASDEALARMLQEIEAMTEEEARRQLA